MSIGLVPDLWAPHGFPYEGKPWGTFCRGRGSAPPAGADLVGSMGGAELRPYRVRLLPKSLFRDIGFCVYG